MTMRPRLFTSKHHGTRMHGSITGQRTPRGPVRSNDALEGVMLSGCRWPENVALRSWSLSFGLRLWGEHVCLCPGPLALGGVRGVHLGTSRANRWRVVRDKFPVTFSWLLVVGINGQLFAIHKLPPRVRRHDGYR